MRLASSVVVVAGFVDVVVTAPLVPTMIVLAVLTVAAKLEASGQPLTQVIPSVETDKVPDKVPVDLSLLVYDPVKVPSELIVSLSLSQKAVDPLEPVDPVDGVKPEDKILPSQVSAKSDSEYNEGWSVRIVRLAEPSFNVCVHVINVLLESIQHGPVLG